MEQDLRQKLAADWTEGEFIPYCFLSEEADALTVYFKGDRDYSKRLTDHVTLLLSVETDDIVGCRIKGIAEILQDFPNYVAVNHGNIELSLLFLHYRGTATNPEAKKEINRLASTAKSLEMTLEACPG